MKVFHAKTGPLVWQMEIPIFVIVLLYIKVLLAKRKVRLPWRVLEILVSLLWPAPMLRNVTTKCYKIQLIFYFQYTLATRTHAKMAQYATNKVRATNASARKDSRAKRVKKRVSF